MNYSLIDDPFSIKVYNLFGQLVCQKAMHQFPEKKLNLSFLSSGVYAIEISDNYKKYIQRVLLIAQ